MLQDRELIKATTGGSGRDAFTIYNMTSYQNCSEGAALIAARHAIESIKL